MTKIENMKQFLSADDRAELLKKLTGYEEAKEMVAKRDRENEMLDERYHRRLRNWIADGRNGERPTRPEYKGYDDIKAAYPAAYAYIRMRECAKYDRYNIAAADIYWYAIDRILQGDDPETVTREAHAAEQELAKYKANRDSAEYQDAPALPEEYSQWDAYHEAMAMYMTARVMTETETTETTAEGTHEVPAEVPAEETTEETAEVPAEVPAEETAEVPALKPFLSDKERAEKLKELTGYAEAIAMYAKYDREFEALADRYRRELCEWEANGRRGAQPTCPEYEGDDAVKAAYPAAYAYIIMQRSHDGEHYTPQVRAIYRYAMDRVLWGDDPETVTREARSATDDFYRYRNCTSNFIYWDAPKQPNVRAGVAAHEEYCRDLALYFTGRAIATEETHEETKVSSAAIHEVPALKPFLAAADRARLMPTLRVKHPAIELYQVLDDERQYNLGPYGYVYQYAMDCLLLGDDPYAVKRFIDQSSADYRRYTRYEDDCGRVWDNENKLAPIRAKMDAEYPDCPPAWGGVTPEAIDEIYRTLALYFVRRNLTEGVTEPAA